MVRSDRAVLLLTGPAGAGKSSTARRLMEAHGWRAVSEDDVWVARGWSGWRTPEQERAVQEEVLGTLEGLLVEAVPVVLEFILYRIPPNPLTAYREGLERRGVTTATAVLRPSLERIERQLRIRARPSDLAEMPDRLVEARHQLDVIDTGGLDTSSVIDPGDHDVAWVADRCAALLTPPRPES